MDDGASGGTRRVHFTPDASGCALVISGPAGVISRPLPMSGSAIVGRELPADIVVADDSVSRRHACIHGGSPPTIEDLGSTNGTKVMGRALAPGERAPLTLGAVVQLGSVAAFVRPRESATDDVPPSVALRRSQRMTVAPPPVEPGPSTPIKRDTTMLQLYALIDVIAPSKLSILVLGETGVGKDVFAESLHQRSPRASARFVRLNCAALPENLLEAELFGYERGAFTGAHNAKPGLFEAADNGTVFLDEIGEMPLLTQAKLLRVLESGEVMRIGSVKPKHVDVRFVAATNQDLEALCGQGRFRSDLFFRLNGVSVTIPPLRDRPTDVVPLAQHFLSAAQGQPVNLTPMAIDRLMSHAWPGNIRELKNVADRAVLLARGGPVLPEHLLFSSTIMAGAPVAQAGGPYPSAPAMPAAPQHASVPAVPAAPAYASAPAIPAAPPHASAPAQPAAAPAGTIRDAFAEVERERILQVMEQCGGNQSRAARVLGISRTTLIKRLEAYGYVRPRKGQD